MIMLKKWMRYMLLAACCLTLAGCGRKETGSELLTETKDAVVPVDGKIDPVVEETPEGTAFHLYCGDENAENIVQKTVYVDKVTEDSVMEQLAQALKLDSNIRLKKISFGMHGGDKVVMLDFNQAFADYMKKLSQSGETVVMGSITNTFLDCYQSELLLVTVEGKVLDTGREAYEEYLEWYPYVESSYKVVDAKLEQDGVSITYPQIEGLGDARMQEKWNDIIRSTEERAMEGWLSGGESQDDSYEVSYVVKTMTPDTLSILMNGNICEQGAAHPYSFKYTYNIDLNTGESIRLADHVDVDRLAENLFAGTGYYVEESAADYFRERLEAIYGTPDSLARSLAGYDYAEDGSAPYGYSYLENGKVWICMEVPHALGDYMEIELDTQQ